MIKSKYLALVFLFVFAVIPLGAHYAYALTGVTLYNQNGSQVTSSSPQPGYYYTQPNGQSQNQVYYFGNGAYFNPTTNEQGTVAGVTINTTVPVNQTPVNLPNTGVGGNAFMNWTTLIVSGFIVLGGVLFIVTKQPSFHS